MTSSTALTKKTNFFARPRNTVLLVAGIVVLWALLRDYLSTLIVLSLVALVIIGLKKPLWALMALIVSQITITDFMVTLPFIRISLRLLLALITLIIVGKAIWRRELDMGSGARRVLTPLFVLVGISIIANLYNISFDLMFKDLRNMLVGVLFAIFLAAIIQNPKQLKILGIAIGIVITASAVIGILQHFDIFGMASATVQKGFLTSPLIVDKRVPGISETELETAYILSATAMVLLCVFLAGGIEKHRNFVLVAILLMVGCLYFTYTRSALFALVLGLLGVLLFVRIRIRWEWVLVMLFIVIFFVVQSNLLSSTFFSGRSENSQLESSVSRTILWQAGVAAALDNPILGTGAGQFLTVSPRYANSVDPYLIRWEEDRYWSWRTLGTLQPHNDFLNVWVSYGTFALIAYLWVHFAILRNCFLAYSRSRSRFMRGISLGMAGALATYVANSFYHNISNTVPLLWILAGFSMVVLKLATEESKLQPVLTKNGKVTKG
jgi:O-antigen ligase